MIKEPIMPDISICSYSFHRLLAEGKQDIFQYIADCKELGCAELDPWSAHLAKLSSGQDAIYAGHNPGQTDLTLQTQDAEYLDRVKQAARDAGLPFGCIAADGPLYAWAPDEKTQADQHALARRWIDVAAHLEARFIRIDPGCREQQPDDETLAAVAEGYRPLVAYAAEKDVRMLVENHWGCSNHPDSLLYLLDKVDGLGLLFDTNNWAKGQQGRGWRELAPYAVATHVKCLWWADDGEELTQHVGHALQLLQAAGYKGTWGIESVPRDLDEHQGVKNTIALIRKYVKD
jgi:sugar phosphate isomerase/epimerase